MNCQTCLTPNFCLTCTSGLVVSATGQCISTCLSTGGSGGIANCLVCASQTACQICQNGYNLVGGQCLQCNVPGCQTCSSANSCATCYSGYTIVPAPSGGTTGATCTLSGCQYPCKTCDSNSQCLTCQTPFSLTPFDNGTCFTCSVANCQQCASNNQYVCTQCYPGYAPNTANTACTWSCPSPFCTTCSVVAGVNTCSQCASGYAVNGNVCSQCNNAPICTSCQGSNLNFCLSCALGYYLSTSNTCLQCAITTCAVCTAASNGQICTSFMASTGLLSYTSTTLTTTTTFPYICDIGCASCAANFPATCLQCSPGFYVMVSSSNIATCYPCGSNCLSCQSNNPNYCLSCYSNAYLGTNGNCISCTYSSNCLTCNPNAINSCTTCPYGYLLAVTSNSVTTCTTPCPSNCLTCFNAKGTSLSGINPNNIACSSCDPGYGLSLAGQCLPCLANCRVCSGQQQSICTQCGAGFYLNSQFGCSICSNGCQSCTPLGCTICLTGYNLQVSNGVTVCVPPCNFPCAACQNNNPNACTACLFGYTLSGNTCSVSTCVTNTNNACEYCAVGSVLVNGACQACGSNCWRCSSTAPSQCTGCASGYFLTSSNTCTACTNGCATCTSNLNCLTCIAGYTSMASSVSSNTQTCLACQLPCQTCAVTT